MKGPARALHSLRKSDSLREVVIEPTFAAWRERARALLRDEISPEELLWRDQSNPQSSLLGDAETAHDDDGGATGGTAPMHVVPKAFLRLAGAVACHRDPERWTALYRVLWRLTHGEPSLLEVATDPEIHRLATMAKAVKRDIHKMHAFVRFRTVETPSADGAAPDVSYVAWFEPAHHVVERAAPLFARRFVSMRWSILTPDRCVGWDGATLRFTPGVSRALAPSEDALEELWRRYYAGIFNPARLSTSTMQAEMPKKYWAGLPEARLISELVRDAPARVARMLTQLDAPPETIPESMQSGVGAVTVPERGYANANSNAHANANAHSRFASSIAPALDAPGAWDPVHDPGAGAARDRAAHARAAHVGPAQSRSAHDATRGPGCLTVNGIPVRVGTASWTDPTLLQPGVFYPDDATTPDTRLRFYTSRFPLVEVDATYYAMPSRATAAAWAARSPEDFVFDIKAFALMTGHPAETKRLPDWLRRTLPRSTGNDTRVYAKDLPTALVDDVWERFLAALSPLRDVGKLGPILLQYPRWFTPTRESADALRAARARLGDAPAAVEFRNPAWVTGRLASRTFALLEQLQLTYVVVDTPPGTGSSMPPVVQVTTPDLAVVRLHGRRSEAWEAQHAVVSERYRYLYDQGELGEWADRITSLAGQLDKSEGEFPDMAKARQGVHVVHNNCHANYGTTNADEITRLLIGFDRDRLREVAEASSRGGDAE